MTIFFNHCFDKRRFNSFLHWFFKKSHPGKLKLLKFLEKLKILGFHSATQAGFSISIDDLKVPLSKSTILLTAERATLDAHLQLTSGNLTIIEQYQRIIEIWNRTSEKLKDQVLQSFQISDFFNPVYLMAFSGARGNISQIRQLVGMRGLMADPQGKIIDFPIRSNFREGLTLTEYLISCSGARKGIVDTALRTAASGYLTRRLVDVAHHVIISQIDCQINKVIEGIFIEDLYDKQKKVLSLQQRLVGRILAETIISSKTSLIIGEKNQEISKKTSQKICENRKKVLIRSPLTCQSSKFICQLCYGWNLAEGQLVSVGEAVGILAAQSIGEPGTQMTMRTFHTGGVFMGTLIDQTYAPFSGEITFPAPCNGLLIRTRQGKIAYLSKNSGILSVRQKGNDNYSNHAPRRSNSSKESKGARLFPYQKASTNPITSQFNIILKNSTPLNQQTLRYQLKKLSFQLKKVIFLNKSWLRVNRNYSTQQSAISPNFISNMFQILKIGYRQKVQDRKYKTKQVRFVFQSFTLLYVRQGEHVVKAQLIAERPFFENGRSLENEQEIVSPESGEIYFENMIFLEKTIFKNEIQLTKNFVQDLGQFWILFGQPFRNVLITKKVSFFKRSDLIDKLVPFSQISIEPTTFLETHYNFLQLEQRKVFLEKVDHKRHILLEQLSSFIFPTYSKHFSVQILFFKNLGYLQVPDNHAFRKTIWTDRILWNNRKASTDVKKFQTWMVGLSKGKQKNIYSHNQIFPIFQKHFQVHFFKKGDSKTFRLMNTYSSKRDFFLSDTSLISSKFFCEFQKNQKNWVFHENTCLFLLNRQGHFHWEDIADGDLLVASNINPKVQIGNRSFHSYSVGLQCSKFSKFRKFFKQYAARRSPSDGASKICFWSLSSSSSYPQIFIKSLFSLLFLKKSRLFQNRSKNWVRQTIKVQPIIIHWQSLPTYKYIFLINFLKSLSLLQNNNTVQYKTRKFSKFQFIDSLLLHKNKQYNFWRKRKKIWKNLKIGLYSFVRVFFCIEISDFWNFKHVVDLAIIKNNFSFSYKNSRLYSSILSIRAPLLKNWHIKNFSNDKTIQIFSGQEMTIQSMGYSNFLLEGLLKISLFFKPINKVFRSKLNFGECKDIQFQQFWLSGLNRQIFYKKFKQNFQNIHFQGAMNEIFPTSFQWKFFGDYSIIQKQSPTYSKNFIKNNCFKARKKGIEMKFPSNPRTSGPSGNGNSAQVQAQTKWETFWQAQTQTKWGGEAGATTGAQARAQTKWQALPLRFKHKLPLPTSFVLETKWGGERELVAGATTGGGTTTVRGSSILQTCKIFPSFNQSQIVISGKNTPIFLLELTFPQSLISSGIKLSNKIFRISSKLQKWTLDFYFDSYFFILQNFCLIKNFETRFFQSSPKEPIMFCFGKSKCCQKQPPNWLQNEIVTKYFDRDKYSINVESNKSYPLVMDFRDSIQDFFQYEHIEYISKKSYRFNDGVVQNFKKYSTRYLKSQIISKKFSPDHVSSHSLWKVQSENLILFLLQKLEGKELFLRCFVFNLSEKNFENFYSISFSSYHFIPRQNRKLFRVSSSGKILQPQLCFKLFVTIQMFLSSFQNFKTAASYYSKKYISYINNFLLSSYFVFDRKLQLVLISTIPILSYSHSGNAFKAIYEKTHSLKIHITKTKCNNFLFQPEGSRSSLHKLQEPKTFQIIKKNYFRSFEIQIFIRFFLPFSFGEIIDPGKTSVLLLTDIKDFFSSHRESKFKRYWKSELISRKMKKNQQLCLAHLPLTRYISSPILGSFLRSGIVISSSRGSLSANEVGDLLANVVGSSSANVVGDLLANEVGGSYYGNGEILNSQQLTLNAGQLIAKTQQTFLFRKATTYLLNNQSILHIQHGDIILKNQRLCSVFYQQSKTGDIVQGIPKIEEIFEARKNSKSHQFLIFSKDFYFFQKKMKQYLQSLQKSVVNNIQRIYCGQGIHISDKHIEIIVRQMTSNVCILEPGQTGLLCGEIVALQWVYRINSLLISNQVIYEPILLGMTKTCLETSSFLSAASFQETTRILGRAALQNQIDFIRGLKQNVILGHLVPIGTGCF